MSELTREDFTRAFEKLGDSQEQHSRDQLSAVTDLAGEIRAMATAFTKHQVPGFRSQENRGGGISLIVAMASIVFGLMAPLYILMSSQGTNVESMDARMRADDARERVDAAEFSALKTTLIEVETQFRHVQEKVADIKRDCERHDRNYEGTLEELGKRSERLRALERKAYGKEVVSIKHMNE